MTAVLFPLTMQASLGVQIFKWFQNNDRCETNEPRRREANKSATLTCEDDDDSTAEHLRELGKEIQKKKFDEDKVCRLLTLTFRARQEESRSIAHSSSRIQEMFKTYPSLKDPRFLAQDLFLKAGTAFTNMGAIYDQCSEMNSRWDMEIMPAIIEYGIQSKVQGSTQALATGNAKAWQCLIILVEKLKPKGNKSKTIERLSRVICVSESVPQCLTKMRSVNDPYIAVIGSIYDVKSCSLICEGKVVVANIGCRIFSMLIVLMGFCHAFCLHYHSEVREALEMLQEKMFGIVEGKKKSTAYLNMTVTATQTGYMHAWILLHGAMYI